MTRNYRGEETTEGVGDLKYCDNCGSLLVSVIQNGLDEYHANCGCVFEEDPLGGDDER